jgi:hypothetical protein
MLSKLRNAPEPLQKQITLRFGLSVGISILLIVMLILSRDIYVLLPFVGAVVFLWINTMLLIYQTLHERYIIVSGRCDAISATKLKKKLKTITLSIGEHKLLVSLKNRSRNIAIGSKVDLFVLKTTPVYEKDGMQVMYTYLAMNIAPASQDQ